MRRRIFDDFGNNYSVNFDGSNDYISAGSTSDFRYYHGATNTSSFAFSIGLWVKLNNPNENRVHYLLQTNNNSSANVGIAIVIDSRTSTSLIRAIRLTIFRGVSPAANAVLSVVTGSNIYPNTTDWVHLLWTYDQALANNNSRFYINNVLTLTNSKTGLTPSTANHTTPLTLGAVITDVLYMRGNLFNIFFAQGVITSGERAALIANPKASPQAIISSATITNAYRFPQGTGNFPTWVDYVGGVSGTMTNQLSSNIQLDTP